MADDLDVEAMLEAPYKEKVQTYNERKGYCYNILSSAQSVQCFRHTRFFALPI